MWTPSSDFTHLHNKQEVSPTPRGHASHIHDSIQGRAEGVAQATPLHPALSILARAPPRPASSLSALGHGAGSRAHTHTCIYSLLLWLIRLAWTAAWGQTQAGALPIGWRLLARSLIDPPATRPPYTHLYVVHSGTDALPHVWRRRATLRALCCRLLSLNLSSRSACLMPALDAPPCALRDYTTARRRARPAAPNRSARRHFSPCLLL